MLRLYQTVEGVNGGAFSVDFDGPYLDDLLLDGLTGLRVINDVELEV